MDRSEAERNQIGKEFKDAFDKIRTPEDLKAEVLCSMRDGKEAAVRRGWKYKRAGWTGVCAAAACAFLLVLFFARQTENGIVTVMEDQVFYEQVSLKDGTLYFAGEQISIEVTPNAGLIGEDTPPKESESKEGEIDRRETADGGTLIMSRAEEDELADVPEDEWSYIGSQALYITVSAERDTYRAVFEKDGEACKIEGFLVSQKEFIEYLLEKVKK